MASLDLEKIDEEIGSPDEDTRWQAVIALAEHGHCENAPDVIWPLVVKWGSSENEDVRIAIATCVLEHILEHHFDEYFEKTATLVRGGNQEFGHTFSQCWKFGNANISDNNAKWDDLNEFAREKWKRK